MSTARRTGMTTDAIISKLEKYRSISAGLFYDQMQPLSLVERKQFDKEHAFLSILQNLIVALRVNQDGLSRLESKRYAFEALLLLTPSVNKKEIPFAKRLERYQGFLRSQQLKTAGKYILDACFKFLSAILALSGVGILFYLYLKDPVNNMTKERSACATLNNSSSLFKQHAKDVYMPTPGVIPKLG